MRKLLLATVAALGVTAVMAETGFAQSSDDSGQAAGPAAGTITVRLNGRVRVYGGVIEDSDANRAVFTNVAPAALPGGTGAVISGGSAFLSPVPFAGPGNVSGFGVLLPGTPTGARLSAALPVAPPVGTSLQRNKQSNYSIGSYTRLYPGFDGVAANGLKYGASVEIRQDNNSGAGNGVYGSITQQARQRGELYLRREWGYIGTDQLGTLRFGSTDGPSGLYMVGNFENFNDGGWNGDVNGMIAGNLQPTWPFADVGQLYTTNKVIYLSPQFYGLDFGIAYEPNTGNVNGAIANGCNGSDAINAFIPSTQGIAGAGCDRLASTTTGDISRRRNTVDVGIRYRGTFGSVGLAAYANYVGGGEVSDASFLLATGNRNQFNGLNVGAGGVAVTFAGLTVGGMAMGGNVNGQWNSSPKGAVQSSAWLAGVSYTYGPLVVGASYFAYYSPGASGPCGTFCNPAANNLGFSPLVGERRERGVAAGGTYSVAPGLALFVSYLWGDRQESGFDFITGQTSTPQSPLAGAQHNTVHSQLLTLGTSFTW